MVASALTVRISAQDNASATFAKVAGSAKSMGQALEGIGKSGSGLATLTDKIRAAEADLTSLGVTLAGFGGAGVAAFGVMANGAMQFESAMANVNSIARLSGAEMDSLQASVLALSRQLGAAPTGLAEALYDINSSGFEANDAMVILEKSAIAARAGLTQTSVAAKAVTSVLNAYGMEAEKAGDVSDVLFKTVDSGVITFEQLAGNLGRVLPVASALNISIEELGAGFAQLTLQGIGASEAETGLASLMQRALAPTQAMTDAVTEYGFASAEALIQSQGFAGYLDFLAQASGGSSEALSALLGDVTAVNAALALIGDSGAGYASALTEMNAAASDGAYTQEVLAIQTETTAAALARLGATLQSIGITMGNALTPFIGAAADGLTVLAEGFAGLPAPIQQTVAVMGALGSVATLAAGSFALVLPRIVAFRDAMIAVGGLRGIISALAAGAFSPLTIAITGAALAAVGLNEIFQNVEARASGVAKGVGLLADEVERLKLAAQPETAEQVQDIIDKIDEQIAFLSGSTLTELVEKGIFPEGTRLIDTVDLQNQLTDAAAQVDEFGAYVTESLAKLPPEAQAAYLDWINTLLSDITYGVEGTNLDEIINDVLTTPLSEVPGVMDAVTGAAGDMAAATDITSRSLLQTAQAAEQADSAMTGLFAEMANDSKEAGAAAGFAAARWAEFVDQMERGASAKQSSIDYMSEMAQAAQEFIAVFLDVTGAADFASQLNLTQLATDASLLAENLTDAAAALDNVQRVIIGNTDAIGQQMQGLADWAGTLIGDPGTWAEIDNLLSEGRISLEQYTAAQQAQTEIASANWQVQRDVLAIQAAQAPILAGAAESTAAYVQQLRELNDGYMDAATGAQDQLAALGWMDQAMQGQVQQVLEMATMLGDLGPAGAAAFDAMIAGIVATDPVMTAMLENLQLIDNVVRDQDGKVISYDVNLDGVEGAMSDIDQLKLSINALIETLGGEVPPLSLDVEGEEQLDDARATIDALPTDKQVGIDFDLPDGSLEDLVNQQGPVRVEGQLDLGDNPLGPLTGDGTGGPELPVSLKLNPPEGGIGALLAQAGLPAGDGTGGPPLTVPIDADTAPAQETIGQIGAVVPRVTAPVDADTEPAKAMIGRLGDDVAPVTVPVRFDMSGWGSEKDGGLPSDFGAEAIEISVTITGADEAAAQLAIAQAAAAALDAQPIDLTVTGEGWQTAADNIEALIGAAQTLDSQAIDLTVTGQGWQTAFDNIQQVTTAAQALDAISPSVDVSTPGAAIATTMLSGVTGAANSIPDSASVTVSAPGAAAAASALYAVASAANSIPSSVSTTVTTNVVTAYSTIGSPAGFTAVRHGGIPAFAGGGLFRAGEAGYEQAVYPGGLTVGLPTDGLYATRQAPYVRPANAVQGGGGLTLNVTVAGNVYGITDLTERIAAEMLPALASELQTHTTAITGGLSR